MSSMKLAQLAESVGVAAVEAPVAVAPHRHEVGPLEHAEVLRDRGPAHGREVAGELAGRDLVVADEPQEPAPGRIRHGVRGGVDAEGLRRGSRHVSIILHRSPDRKHPRRHAWS